MAEILSQAQIDELLGSLQSGDMDLEEVEEQGSNKKIKEYDFTSPKKFTREQLRLLSNIFDSFARLFSLHLSSMLRVSCQMEVLQVEEEDYREFNNALSDSVLVGIINMSSRQYRIEDKQMLLEMARPISFSIVDRLLGGDGSGYALDRDYTEIELTLLDYLYKQVATILKNSWNNYMEIDHELDMLETNSRMIQIIQPDEACAIVVLEITLEGLKGNVNICLPSTALDSVFKVFDSKYVKLPKKGDKEQEQLRRDSILDAISDSSLSVSAELGKVDVSLQDLLNLQPGDIIPLRNAANGSVLLKVEGLPWFTATIGNKKKKYAVKIDKVLE